MKIQLKPRNIIVVGGGSGIGFSAAEKFLSYNAENVILASRNREKLDAAKNKLNSQKVSILPFDISDCTSHEKFISDVTKMIGDIPDGLLISSGLLFNARIWNAFNIIEEEWDKVMNTNLKGVFFLIRNFSNYLYSRMKTGNICVVSSISARRDLLSIYQITKNALSGIVHAYGKHLCERGIILNGIEPGATEDGMLGDLQKYTNGIRTGLPWNDNSIKRVIRPEEIAELICLLMSDLGEVLSGTCVLAGGGCKSI